MISEVVPTVDREFLMVFFCSKAMAGGILAMLSNMGFGALVFSSFVPVQFIGGLMIFSMISTSFGTLIILASLIQMIKKYI